MKHRLLVLTAAGVLAGCAGTPRHAPTAATGTRGQTSSPAATAANATAPAPDPETARLVALDGIAAALLAVDRTGTRVTSRFVVDAKRSGGVATIRFGRGDAIIFVHPAPLRAWEANTWAFVVGHELAHALLAHTRTGPDAETAADLHGAKLAAGAGYDVAGYVGFVCSLADACSRTHGCFHERMQLIEAEFGVRACGSPDDPRHVGHRLALGVPGSGFAFGAAGTCGTPGPAPCSHPGPRCRIETIVDGTRAEIDAPFCIR